jgi:hypothetical protein
MPLEFLVIHRWQLSQKLLNGLLFAGVWLSESVPYQDSPPYGESIHAPLGRTVKRTFWRGEATDTSES